MKEPKQCCYCHWYPHCQLDKKLPCVYFHNQSLTQSQLDQIEMNNLEKSYYSQHNEKTDILNDLGESLKEQGMRDIKQFVDVS